MPLASLIALDINAARFGIGRDLAELGSSGMIGWVFLALLFGLPLASVALLIARRWLALVPLGMWLLLFLWWFSYYASPHSTVTGSAASGLLMYLLLAWWVFFLAVARPWRWRPVRRAAAGYRAALHPRPLLNGPEEET
jgi:hypothetical protein